jgi:hypothetical protein
MGGYGGGGGGGYGALLGGLTGIGGSLLSGIGDKKAAKKQKKALAAQQAPFNQILAQAMQAMGQIPPELWQSGFPQFTEEAPGLTGLQQMSLAGLERVGMGQEGVGGATGQLVGQGRNTLQEIMQGGPAGFEDWFQSSVYDPAIEALMEKGGTIDALRGRSTSTGNRYSTLGTQEEGNVIGRTLASLAQQRKASALEYETARRSSALQAVSQIGGLESVEPNILLQMLEGGGVGQRADMAQYASRLAEFERMLGERNKRLGFGYDTAVHKAGFPIQQVPNNLQIAGQVAGALAQALGSGSGGGGGGGGGSDILSLLMAGSGGSGGGGGGFNSAQSPTFFSDAYAQGGY